MSLTNTGEDRLLNLFKGDGPYYLALYTTAPTDAGGGTEVSGSGYARQQVTFGNPSSGSMSNSAAIAFPTATGSWGTVKGWGLVDASTSGNLVWYGTVDAAKEIAAGDIYRVDAGGLTLSMD